MKGNPDLYSELYNKDEHVNDLIERMQNLYQLIEELKKENQKLNDMLDAYRYGD